MTVKNPTNNDITVQIMGVKYTVPANGEVKYVPEEHALYWRDKLHQFLVLGQDVVEKTEKETPKKEEAKVEEPTKVDEPTKESETKKTK